MSEKDETVAIIQARMGSTRLPGKVLADVCGEPLLYRVVDRVRQAATLSRVVVATSDLEQDDPIEALCRERGCACFRGDHEDVLARFRNAAVMFGADIVVRVTGDCPLVDPGLIDEAVRTFTGGDFDFVANRLPPPWERTYPIGLDVEVCSRAALETAFDDAVLPRHREHVMPFLYEGNAFRVKVLDSDKNHGGMRWAVDTAEDLEFVRHVFARLANNTHFTWLDVLALLDREPQLLDINARVRQKSLYDG